MTVTRVSRTKQSSDCAVGTLEFEFKEDSRNGRVSDLLRKICFRDFFKKRTKYHKAYLLWAAGRR